METSDEKPLMNKSQLQKFYIQIWAINIHNWKYLNLELSFQSKLVQHRYFITLFCLILTSI